MFNIKNNFHYHIILLIILSSCLLIFITCNGHTSLEADDETGTWVEFKNLESFPVTVYSDSARQTVTAEVGVRGTKKISAISNPIGTAYYPTFHLDLFDIPGISIPYNGPAVVILIEEDKTNPVSIPNLDSVETGFAYIKLNNKSIFSLALLQGNAEKKPLSGSSSIIMPDRSVVYEIVPGPSSGYSIMRNTTTPIAFPESLTEFKEDVLYEIDYNGTSLAKVEKPIQEIVLNARKGILVPGASLTAKLSWLQANVASGNDYTIEVTANESISPVELSYSGKNNIGITLIGTDTAYTISLSSNGSMFSVKSGVRLVLDNITLRGRSGNNSAIITVNSGGILVMKAGAVITGNTNSYNYGGGVNVSGGTFTMNSGKISNNTSSGGGGVYNNNAIFTMNGGEISGNTSSNSNGGGVYVISGTLTMSGGIIYGNNAEATLKNTAKNEGAALYLYNSTIKQYGTFNGASFIKSGDLFTSNDTIRIVNGNLLTE